MREMPTCAEDSTKCYTAEGFAGFAKLAKGAGLKILSRRSPRFLILYLHTFATMELLIAHAA